MIFRKILFICILGSMVAFAPAASFADSPIPEAKPLPSLGGNAVENFIAVAFSQLGYEANESNQTVYWKWAGSQGSGAWCSEFASWCGAKAGVSNYVPKKTSSKGFRSYYAGKGAFFSVAEGCHDAACGCAGKAVAEISGSQARRGDIILLDTDGNLSDGPDHTAIVYGADSEYIYTIDGNSHAGKPYGSVRTHKRAKSTWNRIHGICRPFPPVKISAAIKASRVSVLPKKKTRVTITSNSGSKITVWGKTKNAKKRKYVKIASGTKATIAFQKKARKGTYQFYVTTEPRGVFEQTTQIITIRVTNKAAIWPDQYAVKSGAASTVTIRANSGAKLKVKGKSGNARNKAFVKCVNGKKARLNFQAAAPRGTYSFKVTSPRKGKYKKTTKTITITVY